MKIGLIGCGRVGISIFYSLRRYNKIVGIYDIDKRNLALGKRLLRLKGDLTPEEVCQRSEAIFIATPDDKIKVVYQEIKKYIKTKKFIFHFSGCLSSRVIPKSKNVCRGSIHPFATFPGVELSLKKIFLYVEGDRPAISAIKKIFPKDRFLIRMIKPEFKGKYHLIGVFASNLLIGYLNLIRELSREIGWKGQEFYEVVIPIIEDTLENIKRDGLKNALSGPLKRGDVETVRRHLQILKKKKSLDDIYRLLSGSILKGRITELDNSVISEIRRCLDKKGEWF